MEKNDLRSLGLSLVINILVILLLPGMKVPVRDEGKISVGLIELRDENRKVTPKKQEKKVEKPAEPAKTPTETVEEKPAEESKKEVAAEEKKAVKKPLPEIAPMPDIEVLVSKAPVTDRRKPAEKSQTPRQERVFEDTKTEEKREIVGAELERREVSKVEATPIISQTDMGKIAGEGPESKEEGKEFMALANGTDKLEGLPKGYKDIGSPDGSLTGKWDANNNLPRYPESAELRGKSGTVVLKVYVTEEGKVERVEMQGSGVPELNSAIEQVARSWKIYLSRNGQRVYGDVTLEIPFRLLRGE
ncbi:hypothetical protein PM10SUCC1_13930 [Propionigenium maris DSM 9537]|uniref:TonB C-terminal domain-containing protein n=1 Tax=Propionigenium maris DSM 9537 TaxID=1123000 RepID=A0A9W6LMJ6_9FUSO|nr:energy transducer TonB [Propionigenium maris]GLI55879.1 hypothetical protein PM10SUCC1_13930 [Propionigenium maris DSM 9537]